MVPPSRSRCRFSSVSRAPSCPSAQRHPPQRPYSARKNISQPPSASLPDPVSRTDPVHHDVAKACIVALNSPLSLAGNLSTLITNKDTNNRQGSYISKDINEGYFLK